MATYIKLLFLIIYASICSIFALIFSLDRTFTLYFWLSKVFSKGIFFISGVKLKITGLENVDKDSAYIFVSNHSSQFDIVTLQAAVSVRTSIVFKKELGRIPLFGWQLVTGPYISIDRRNAERAFRSIERAKNFVRNRKISVLLFAEGTRSLTGEIQPFKRGAFNLAAKVGAPIIPCTVKGTSAILPKGSLRINRGVISVHFDKPVDTSEVSSRQQEIQLMNDVREIIISNFNKM